MDEDTVEKKQTQRALNKAYFFLKFRPRSEKEVRDYLVKKSESSRWPPSVIELAIASLKESKYVDDAEFVRWFVEQRSSGKPKSTFALMHELQKFGIYKEVAQIYFQENPIQEEELADKALLRKWSRFQHLNKQERFKKAVAFLSARGFSFDLIKKSIEKLENT